MALPTLVKTWQHNVNQAIAAQGTVQATQARIFRLLKNSLIGFGTLPWTTRGSSNGTTGAMDAVDRWTTDVDLVWNFPGNAHSWYVFRQTGIATNYEFCIDLNHSTPTVGSLIVSPSAGFTGGSTTARPTATDEIVLINQTNIGGCYNGVDNDVKLHVQQSTDGQCTRVMMWSQNNNTAFYLFDKPQYPVTGWTNPSVSMTLVVPTGVAASVVYMFNQANARGRGTGTFNMFLTSEAANNTCLMDALTTVNDFDSAAPFFPIGLLCVTAPHRGRHGALFDLWYGMTIIANADTYPNDSSKQFAQLGDVILPWNGTVPLIT